MEINYLYPMQLSLVKFIVPFLLLLASHNTFAEDDNDCIRVYNQGQAHWLQARKMDDAFMENVQNFIKGDQTCEGLVEIIKECIQVYQEFEKANGRFMTAELDHCPRHKMPGFENSAKLKQQKIRDRMEEIQYIFGDLRKEAVRVACIKEDELKMPKIDIPW